MQSTTDTGSSTPKKKTLLGRLWQIVKYGALSLIVIAIAAHFIFKYTGSGEWEPAYERDGVVVFSKKIPGSTVMQFKGIARMESSLTSFTRFMQDPTTCDDVGCTDTVIIKTESPQAQYMSFVYDYAPFEKRQFVVKVDVSQDPKTKDVKVHYIGFPDLVPVDDCCIRVPHMNNQWVARPKGGKDIEVEYIVDMYEGGWIPYFVLNFFHAKTPYHALTNIRDFFKSEKFRKKYVEDGVVLPFIVEPE